MVSYFILYFSLLSIFWIFQTFWIFYHKSSDLSMVNPHFSLNPQNPQIYGAILRFPEDFYCEIHRFHDKSSDLAQRISLNPCQIWGLFHPALSECQWTIDRLPFTQSPLSVPLSSQICNCQFSVQLKAGLSIGLYIYIYLNIDLRPQICVGFLLLIFYSIHLIMKSLCFGWNPRISL